MKEWVKCFYFDMNKPSGVFPCIFRTSDKVIVVFKEKEYDIPIENTRVIDAPEYDYGDLVSPINHLEIEGVIHSIGYHFDRKEPIYYLKVNGKRKAKRYFKDDLLRRN